ncbi:unnamed protein product [Rhizophagus irregularis]|nr:unnamed protein product [Rhizophagus irregularis]
MSRSIGPNEDHKGDIRLLGAWNSDSNIRRRVSSLDFERQSALRIFRDGFRFWLRILALDMVSFKVATLKLNFFNETFQFQNIEHAEMVLSSVELWMRNWVLEDLLDQIPLECGNVSKEWKELRFFRVVFEEQEKTNRSYYFYRFQPNSAFDDLLSSGRRTVQIVHNKFDDFFGNDWPNLDQLSFNIRQFEIWTKWTILTKINNKKEKENIAEVEQEPKNNPKKKSVKRKVSNDTDSNVNWQDHEIDLLIQYIGNNFDEYRKGNKTKMFNEISSNVLKNKEPNAIKSKLARLIKTYSEVKKHNEKSGEARKIGSIDIEEDEELFNNKSKFSKKQKKNNVDTIAIAIS